MVEYIYFVKCPNCEDEHFSFFDEAKEFALGCLSAKPIITQTEVCRNDFGECTDSADLGTVWSWEDMMKDVEPEDTVFSKAETFGISEGIDDFDDFDIGPQIDEFADVDNSLDFDFEEDEAAESVEEAMSKVQQDYLSRRTPITKDEFAERLENEDEILIFTGDPREAGIRGRDYFAAKVDGKYEVSFWDETYEDEFTDSEIAETFDTIDDLWAFMVNFMEDDDFNPEYNYLAEGCTKKAIPEGMTIEQLQEEMEENEDTVECSKCGNLVEKANCHHNQEGFGWCCNTCEPADTLVEDAQEEYSIADLVADSINHLVNDLGKDPWADDFGDEIVKDIENNYENEAPTDLAKYNSWANSIMSEVSRQVNRDYELDEEVEPDEVHDLGNTYDGGYSEDPFELDFPEV